MRQFFTEANDRLSMVRLCTFILIIGGVAMAFIHPDNETGYLGMIGLGLTGKVGQKFFENKKASD